jgi:hypothetical protein
MTECTVVLGGVVDRGGPDIRHGSSGCAPAAAFPAVAVARLSWSISSCWRAWRSQAQVRHPVSSPPFRCRDRAAVVVLWAISVRVSCLAHAGPGREPFVPAQAGSMCLSGGSAVCGTV